MLNISCIIQRLTHYAKITHEIGSISPDLRLLDPPSRWLVKNDYYTLCQCPQDCNERVEWRDRYFMTPDCTKNVIGQKIQKINTKSTTAISGKTTVRISTYHSDESVDENGFYSGALLTFQGSRIPDDLRIHNSSRQYKDFEEWYRQRIATLQRKRDHERERDAKKRKSMSDEEHRADLEKSKVRSRKRYRKSIDEGLLVREKKSENDCGGWTEEFNSAGIVNRLMPVIFRHCVKRS